jgi:triacylglycerol lipase
VLSSLAPARRRLLLVLIALLAAAAVATGVLFALRSGNRTAPAVAQDRPGPVLLVPGYGDSVSALATLARRLRAAGKDATVVDLPDHAQGDLGRQADALGAAAHAALARTGAASVDVVGYSAGGVVARLWAKDRDGARLARRVVTLGSPQHGTALAALGSLVSGACPLACQQLVPTSSLLSALNNPPELPSGPVFVSLWTSRDEVVLPPDSARLTGAVNIEIQQVCAGSEVGHSQLPTDPLVAAMVVAELASGPARQFGAADCARLGAAG